jgi:hypothetical protein
MVHICEPETGRGLDEEENEMRSADDLKTARRAEKKKFQIAKRATELRSAEDLTDCHEDSQGISHCQLGNDQR